MCAIDSGPALIGSIRRRPCSAGFRTRRYEREVVYLRRWVVRQARDGRILTLWFPRFNRGMPVYRVYPETTKPEHYPGQEPVSTKMIIRWP